jgi:NADH-quinone oxidoreductase subunit E
MNVAKVSDIIERYGADKTASLAILQDIQAEYNYLPRAALEETARQLDVPISDIYRMATFFKAFSLQPRGKNVVKVCMGTACHVRGGPAILDTLEREIGVQAGNTTKDNEFTLEAVRCVGACALGPVVLVNEEPHGNMTRDAAVKLIQGLEEQEPMPEEAEETSVDVSSKDGPVDLSAVPPAGNGGG